VGRGTNPRERGDEKALASGAAKRITGAIQPSSKKNKEEYKIKKSGWTG